MKTATPHVCTTFGFVLGIALAANLGCHWHEQEAVERELGSEDEVRSVFRDAVAADVLIAAGDYERAHTSLAHLAGELPVPGSLALRTLTPERRTAYKQRYVAVLVNAGVVALRMHRFDDAEALFDRAISIEPQDALAHRNRGTALLQSKDFESARISLERALALNSGRIRTPRLYLDLGRALAGSGRTVRARWAFTQARRGGTVGLERALAFSRRSAALPVDADSDLYVEVSLEAWGVLIDADRELARLSLAADEPAVAEQYLRRALSLAPGDAESLYLLVRVLAVGGRHDEAARTRSQFERAAAETAAVQAELKANSGRLDALQFVADTYRGQGLLHLAQSRYRQLLARHPQDRKVQLALHKLQVRAATLLKGHQPLVAG